MTDYPQEAKQPIATEIHQMMDSSSHLASKLIFDVFTKENSVEETDPIFIAAQSIANSLGEGFNLHSVHDLFAKSYEFVKLQQGLSLEDQKQTLIKLIDYIIDITDTPYLPDTLTDPIFKALTPTLLDLFLNFQGENAKLIPQITLEKLSPDTFQDFVSTLKETYSDGFQLSDIAVYVEKTAIFVMGFTNLSEQEKIDSTCDIINMIIDNMNFGPLPSSITSAILKCFTKPIVHTIFSNV